MTRSEHAGAAADVLTAIDGVPVETAPVFRALGLAVGAVHGLTALIAPVRRGSGALPTPWPHRPTVASPHV